MNNEIPFKVKCVDTEILYLTVGKEYDVVEVDECFYKVRNDCGITQWYYDSRFEVVTTPKDKQEFSVGDKVVVNNIIPTFEVGDKVYFPNMAEGKVLTLLDNKACHYPFFVNVVNAINNSLYELDSNGKTKYGNFTDVVLKATQENYEMLCKLYPHIEFELPHKEITGSDLTKGMFERGDFAVVCKCSNIGEISAFVS